ncbi:MAG: SDR family NAD(P)-dependent oxidoreductase [Candidatus Hydrogenedentota bacterium]
MRVFVTGADGLLGSNLVRQLLARGDAVRVLIYPGSTSTSIDELDLERIEGDLLDDGFDLAAAMADCDAVFHCAAITDLWAPADFTRRVNVEGTRRLLDAALDAGAGRLVFVGSASSFAPGSIDAPGDETGPFPELYRGVAYMESKHEAAELVRNYVGERGLDAVIVAPTFLLGPYDSRPSGGEIIRRFLMKGMRHVSHGGRNFAYAPDVAAGAIGALDKGRTGETYILGGQNMDYFAFFTLVARCVGGVPPKRALDDRTIRRFGALVETLAKLSGKKPQFNRTIARFALEGMYYTSQKAVKELGMPQTPTAAAIEESVGALRAYGHVELARGDAFMNKVVLVAGGSRGVGYAMARALVYQGAQVVVSARTAERVESAAASLRRLGGEAVAVAGDIAQWDDAEAMVLAAVEEFGRLDIVINNAGLSMRGRFAALTPEVIRQVTDANLTGVMHVTRAAAPHLEAAAGSVVFISSIAGIMGLPGASVYCATKRALTGLAESLRIEWAAQGVHVGVVHLGFTERDPQKTVVGADGTAVPPDRPTHMLMDVAAARVLGCIRRRRHRVVLTSAGKLGAAVYRIAPGFVIGLIARAQAGGWGIFRRYS